MTSHKVVSHEEWIEARKRHLTKEKELTRLRDELSRERRELPWEEIRKEYVFEGSSGKETLAELFGDKTQLIVYHFMFGPDWEAGCKSCSLIADHFNPAIVHLNHRDASMAAVSRAPYGKLEAFKKRMGWTFKWVSSQNTDFNYDFHVSFSEEQVADGNTYYNYKKKGFPSTEAHGASVFYKDEEGGIYHTYSVYERGLDRFIAAYHYLDIVPKGRDEEELRSTMAWLRLRDEYED